MKGLEIKEKLMGIYAQVPSNLHNNPCNTLLHVEMIEADQEKLYANYSYTVSFDVMNHLGVMHGGFTSGIMDEAMGATANVFAPEGYFATTSDMQFNCLKAMHEGDELLIHTKLQHMGKRTIVAKAEIWRGKELCAFSTENFAVIKSSKLSYAENKTE